MSGKHLRSFALSAVAGGHIEDVSCSRKSLGRRGSENNGTERMGTKASSSTPLQSGRIFRVLQSAGAIGLPMYDDIRVSILWVSTMLEKVELLGEPTC